MIGRRKTGKILKRAQTLLFASFLCLLLLPLRAWADTYEGIVSSKTSSEDIYLYLSGVSSVDKGTKIQIGNVDCGSDSISVAAITSSGIPIKTVLLLDNSVSLNKIWGTNAKKLLSEIIDGHAEGEQFKLATFAKELSVVSDFSTDYSALKDSVNNITFVDQSTYLTDILYDMVSSFKDNGEAGFVRIIVITDGANDKKITYTQDELKNLLKEASIPVHTVGASSGKNNDALNLLFSYSRASLGKDSLVEKKTGTTDIYNSLKEDYSMQCIKVSLPESLKDGSSKNAKLTVKTGSEEKVFTTNLTMPFGSGKQENGQSDSAKGDSVQQESQSVKDDAPKKTPVLPTITTEKPKESSKKSDGGLLWIVWVVVAVAVLAVAAVLGLMILKKKNGPASGNHGLDSVTTGKASKGQQAAKTATLNKELTARHTMMLGGSNTNNLAGSTGEKTEMLSFGGSVSEKTEMLGASIPAQPKVVMLVLEDYNEPSKKYSCAFTGNAIIGRSAASDIPLTFDTAVSSRHCEINSRDGQLYLKDLQSSNGTKYNGLTVTSEVAFNSGDFIEIGRGKYRIKIEE